MDRLRSLNVSPPIDQYNFLNSSPIMGGGTTLGDILQKHETEYPNKAPLMQRRASTRISNKSSVDSVNSVTKILQKPQYIA